MKKLIYLFILGIGFTSCSVEPLDSTENLLTADAKANIQVIEESVSFLKSEICAGEAPVFVFDFPQNTKGNGKTDIKIQIETYPGSGDWVPFKDLTFTGAGPEEYTYNDEVLETGTYNFRIKIGSGGFTSDITLKVVNCNPVCAYGKGYWRNHSSDNPGGEQENMWPVAELMLGNKTYSQDELNIIMDVPNNEGNNLVIFSQHLIAAKLNVANGAGTTEINNTIAEADDLIGNLVVLENSFTQAQKTAANILKDILEVFNEAGCE